MRRLADQLARIGQERQALAGRQVDPAILDQAAAEETTAQAALIDARAAVDAAERAHTTAASDLAAAA